MTDTARKEAQAWIAEQPVRTLVETYLAGRAAGVKERTNLRFRQAIGIGEAVSVDATVERQEGYEQGRAAGRAEVVKKIKHALLVEGLGMAEQKDGTFLVGRIKMGALDAQETRHEATE